jgi:hypothetical protein
MPPSLNHPYLHHFTAASPNSSDDDDDGPAYSDPVLQAKYDTLRKERRRMKNDAIRDLGVLRDLAGVKEAPRPQRKQRPPEETAAKQRRRIEKEAKMNQEKEKQERKERLFKGLEAARVVEKEAQAAKDAERERQAEIRRKVHTYGPKYQPNPRQAASREGGSRPVHERVMKEPRYVKAQRKRATLSGVDSPVHGSSKPTTTSFSSSSSASNTPERAPRATAQQPRMEKRPEWCNSKRPERHVKSSVTKVSDVPGEFNDFFKHLFDDMENDKRRDRENNFSSPRVAKETPVSEESPPSPVNNRPKYETAGEKANRERMGRLNANRAALGLDGGAAKQKPQQQSRPRTENPPRRQQTPEQPRRRTTSEKFGDLDAELDKFKERADRERREREADDLTIKTYEQMWVGFEMAIANKMQIGWKEIPWLPVLKLKGPTGVESWKTLGVPEHADLEEKKAALRSATMRWHPDRFASKFGSVIKEVERVGVMEEVVKVSQRINEIRARFDREVQREEGRT